MRKADPFSRGEYRDGRSVSNKIKRGEPRNAKKKTTMDGDTSLQIPEPSFMEIGSWMGLKVEFVALVVCVEENVV